jgi:hypothetical protein
MAAVEQHDLEGIVGKRKSDPYRRGVKMASGARLVHFLAVHLALVILAPSTLVAMIVDLRTAPAETDDLADPRGTDAARSDLPKVLGRR